MASPRSCLLALGVAGLLAAAPASAKEFASIAVVGADGRSTEIRAAERVIYGLLGGRARAQPRGGYVRIYPLGTTGHVGVPGRFYPTTGAVCLSWNQAARPRSCGRPSAKSVSRLLTRTRGLQLFRGSGATLARLRSADVRATAFTQLRVAFELAFDRSRLARRTSRPTHCLRFSGSWRGRGAATRPRQFCLAESGVWASGLLYPLGVEPFRFAHLNRR